MASKSRDCRAISTEKKGDSSSGSSESSTSEEEERLRRLFTACDRDGDGFIDRYKSLCINVVPLLLLRQCDHQFDII